MGKKDLNTDNLAQAAQELGESVWTQRAIERKKIVEERELPRSLSELSEKESNELAPEEQYVPGNDSSLSPQKIVSAYGEATGFIVDRLFALPKGFNENRTVPVQRPIRILDGQFNVLSTLAHLSGQSINVIAINLLNEILTAEGSLSINKALKKYIDEKTNVQRKSALEALNNKPI